MYSNEGFFLLPWSPFFRAVARNAVDCWMLYLIIRLGKPWKAGIMLVLICCNLQRAIIFFIEMFELSTATNFTLDEPFQSVMLLFLCRDASRIRMHSHTPSLLRTV